MKMPFGFQEAIPEWAITGRGGQLHVAAPEGTMTSAHHPALVTHIVLDTSWPARLGSPRIPGLPSPGRCLGCRKAQDDARS